ncbi:hypothetical protein HK102_013304, partial [Quaeritorhiza haematococci]
MDSDSDFAPTAYTQPTLPKKTKKKKKTMRKRKTDGDGDSDSDFQTTAQTKKAVKTTRYIRDSGVWLDMDEHEAQTADHQTSSSSSSSEEEGEEDQEEEELIYFYFIGGASLLSLIQSLPFCKDAGMLKKLRKR